MHGRKLPQIHWLLKKMHTMATFSRVLDVGGGRGDLAVHIAESFPHCQITVVDSNASSLLQGRAFALQKSEAVHSRIHFVCAQFTSIFSFANVVLGEDGIYTVNSASIVSPTGGENSSTVNSFFDFDFVVALHACGGLSDLAMDFAVLHSCQFLVCPCCYLKHRYVPSSTALQAFDYCFCTTATTVHVQLSATSEASSHCTCGNDNDCSNNNDSNNCSIGAGGDSPVVLRLAESDNRSYSVRASRIINSQRMNRMQFMAKQSGGVGWKFDIEQFPKEYSLRNMVLSSAMVL